VKGQGKYREFFSLAQEINRVSLYGECITTARAMSRGVVLRLSYQKFPNGRKIRKIFRVSEQELWLIADVVPSFYFKIFNPAFSAIFIIGTIFFSSVYQMILVQSRSSL